MKKTGRNPGDLSDRSREREFVCLRRLIEAADFSHELKRGGTNLLIGDWRIEIEKNFDVPAHLLRPHDLEDFQAAQKNQRLQDWPFEPQFPTWG